MEYVDLFLEIADEIALLTVNRPQALNALNLETLKEPRHFFMAVQEDAKVKVVVITGAGEKVFVAGGGDLAGMAPMGPLAARESAPPPWKRISLASASPRRIRRRGCGPFCKSVQPAFGMYNPCPISVHTPV